MIDFSCRADVCAEIKIKIYLKESSKDLPGEQIMHKG